jgi:hypothetical protein
MIDQDNLLGTPRRGAVNQMNKLLWLIGQMVELPARIHTIVAKAYCPFASINTEWLRSPADP